MKRFVNISQLFIILNMLLVCLSLTSCRRNGEDVWEDTKSASRHVKRGVRTMGGKHGDSRQIQSQDEFYGNGYTVQTYTEGDFIPLSDNANSNGAVMANSVSPQPRENPGDPGSSIPGIDSFRDPSTVAALSGIFKNVHFEYNQSLVKGQENLEIIKQVATYLTQHPNTYAFVEGHTDERGPEAYNLALGSRRSNAVRNLLISEGVSPDNLFTISYGKERPLIVESNEDGWAQNRRVEFKVYQR